MNTTSSKQLLKNIIISIVITLMIFSFTSCSKKITFFTSTVVPAAEGVVTIKKDKNKNYIITIQITDLADVSRLQGMNQTYVVWMVGDLEKTENIGQLKSSRSILTKQLKATLKAVSSSYPSKIFITAENDGRAQYPNGQIVLSTDKF